jgi:murein DD-endopeptidase MepM/ murein hydrolase activator NlpD
MVFATSRLLSWSWSLSNSVNPDTFTSAFGPRDEYTTPGLQYDFHEGMDLQAQSPQNVYAAHSGIAHLVPESRNEGNWIYLIHKNSLANELFMTSMKEIQVS